MDGPKLPQRYRRRRTIIALQAHSSDEEKAEPAARANVGAAPRRGSPLIVGQKMILVFQDDTTMRVIESVDEANRLYESVDIEDGSLTFLDSRGCFMRPLISRPSKKRLSVVHVPFTLETTNEKRADLLAELRSGEFTIDPRSAGVRSLTDLEVALPALFIP